MSQVLENVLPTGSRTYRLVVGKLIIFYPAHRTYFCVCAMRVFSGIDLWQISDDTCTGSDGQGRSGNAAVRSGNRRKRKSSGKDKNIRRLESNERERLRMHSINDAFQVYCETFNILLKVLSNILSTNCVIIYLFYNHLKCPYTSLFPTV